MEKKIKIKLVKFEKAIAVQILYMDERFRNNTKNACYMGFNSGSFVVFSETFPELLTNSIGLWGYDESYKLNVPTLMFSTNDERDEYVENMFKALKDWAENWPGFKEDSKVTESTELIDTYEF